MLAPFSLRSNGISTLLLRSDGCWHPLRYGVLGIGALFNAE